MASSPSMLPAPRATVPLRWGVLLLLAVAAYVGWREFWFLTDDAFITFRYISNSLRGYGHTWNPPPFQPVEGYSNFLWMVLLEGVWRVFGVEPPDAANGVSLIFSYGTLALGFFWVWRMALPPELARYRFALAVAVLAGVLSNRTFLAWMSSGLETALFIFCTTLWCVAMLEQDREHSPRAVAVACTAAALSALTRPDGMLLVAASGVLVLMKLVQAPPRGRWVLTALPLLAVPLHIVWRRLYYGEWLPNTYYAKHVQSWPESGLRYALCFLIEYGLWVWLVVGLVAAVRLLRGMGWREVAERLWRQPGHVAVVGVLLAHFAYYTLNIGGDHFEYRVYAHLVLPLMVAFVAFLGWLRVGRTGALALMGTFLLLGLPVQWVHYAKTRELTTRKQTYRLRQPIADAFPAPVRPLVALFDAQQDWLISHFVGMRHQEHKVFFEHWRQEYPTREEGEKLALPERPMLVTRSVGVPGWVLPDVIIIDYHGLNDRVVARTPVKEQKLKERIMAHDRTPPAGYLECFEPNVQIKRRQIRTGTRKTPLTDERIRECEARFDPSKSPPPADAPTPDAPGLTGAGGE
ncbi:hypothetical protein F0U59_27275 [Archangium gephyra]|nr:hypothetical protein F0U59_27275 [Archangium gephyra]